MKPSSKNEESRFITRAEWFRRADCCIDLKKMRLAVQNNGITYVGLSSEMFHTEIMRRENLEGDIEYGYIVEI